DSLSNWTPVGNNVTVSLSMDRLEGSSSLHVVGYADPFGNVGATYYGSNSTNVDNEASFVFWAKCNAPSTLGVLFIDQQGNSRTYYDVSSDGISCTSTWKRFVLNLVLWSNETPGFEP